MNEKQLILIARLLEYPEVNGLLASLDEARKWVDDIQEFSEDARTGLHGFLNWLAQTDALEVQSAYVSQLDRSRKGSLYLFEHVHGESRERGGAMADLMEFYAQQGSPLRAKELPDFLPVVLEFSACIPDDKAIAFLGEISHVVEAIAHTHQKLSTPWVPVFNALLEVLGIQVSKGVADMDEHQQASEDLDAVWAEPVVEFSCSGGKTP
jgi:nitrate reductase molybdenum cofactor assembly chaperone NarJ/NarW